MNAPLWRQLSREEFNQLSVDQQLDYTRELMDQLHERLLDTRRQLEEAKRTISSLEQKNSVRS